MDFIKMYEEMFALIQIPLSEEYISSSLSSAIIVGLIACALIVFTAISSKKSLGLGVVAGIFAIIGSVANHFAVVYFHSTVFFKTIIVQGTVGSDLQGQLNDAMLEHYAENLPKMGIYLLANLLLLAGWVLSLIFIIKMIKLKPKVLGIFALVLHIIRYLLFASVDMISPIVSNSAAVEAIQKSQDIKVYAMTLIPLILVAIAGLVTMIKNSKTPAPVEQAAAPEAAPEAQDSAE